MKKRLLLFILVQLLFCSFLYAQNNTIDLEAINEKRITMNSNGMLVLGGWAVSNLVIGGIGMTQTGGTSKYFHQMNAAWNTVNLAIAGFGYYGIRNQSTQMGLSETISEFHNFEKILLFNAGLDIGYMAIGAFLWERGLRKENNRLIGYGQSMILQGGFLFVFDAVLYLLSRSESSRLIESLNYVQFNGMALSLNIPF
ncbi:MAG: hypothetical protein EA359_14965 [Balneolaceae bacterium]|nr:MAG: hypothetical protein EA359_14965 [Balneolaceae bacterium]